MVHRVGMKETALDKAELKSLSMPYTNTIDEVAREFGGAKAFIKACKLSTVPAVQNMVRIYETYNGKKAVSACCEQADLQPVKLIEYVAPAMYQWNGPVAKMLHALNQPKVMKASITSALVIGPEGLGDRKMQMEMAGFIKAPAGTNIFNQVNVGDIESFEDNVIDVTPTNVQSPDNQTEPQEG